MKMAPTEPASLRDCLAAAARSSDHRFWGVGEDACCFDLLRGSCLGGRLAELAGRSVLLATGSQLTTALALIELDGVARRITLCPTDLSAEHFPFVAASAGADAIVYDGGSAERATADVSVHVICSPAITPIDQAPFDRLQTEWLLLTSGTTGVPKLVMHSLAGLTAAIKRGQVSDQPIVWGTFYDIRRYGGLQIFFRAVMGGASLVLSSAGEPVADHLARLGKHGVTHLSGTPSHWRRALMSPAIHTISPRYVRLSGEIADQAVLDNLRAVFPHASVGHAYASTEAGVGFEVTDGREGFPASMIGRTGPGVDMKIADGSLRIRSTRNAACYVGANGAALKDDDGFVDTGDMIEIRGDRCYFVGRRGGIINVGGLKVHPEEIEAVINRHPDVRMSLVRPKKSPVTGAIVVADVVLNSTSEAGERLSEVKGEILKLCRDELARHKVPAAISFVPALAVAATGKLARQYA
jgi:acyl-coenzyme A synthetase/AMP-(fatty) acid ligase